MLLTRRTNKPIGPGSFSCYAILLQALNMYFILFWMYAHTQRS